MLIAQHFARSTGQTLQRACIANRVRGGVCAAQSISLYNTNPARSFAARPAQVHMHACYDQLKSHLCESIQER